MVINTRFNLGQKVRRSGYKDIGIVTEINISIDDEREPNIRYEVFHLHEDNPHVGTSFGGSGYESEFEEIDGA